MLIPSNGRIYPQLEVGGTHPIIVAVVRNNEMLLKQLDQAFGLCGYYKTYGGTESENLPDGFIQLQYEPRYSDNEDRCVKEIGILYHVTPTKHVDKILKNGLCPRANNKTFKYPPRVYFLLGNVSYNYLLDLIAALAYGSVTQSDNEYALIDDNDNIETKWTILAINVSKLPKDIKFYDDMDITDGAGVFYI